MSNRVLIGQVVSDGAVARARLARARAEISQLSEQADEARFKLEEACSLTTFYSRSLRYLILFCFNRSALVLLLRCQRRSSSTAAARSARTCSARKAVLHTKVCCCCC